MHSTHFNFVQHGWDGLGDIEKLLTNRSTSKLCFGSVFIEPDPDPAKIFIYSTVYVVFSWLQEGGGPGLEHQPGEVQPGDGAG